MTTPIKLIKIFFQLVGPIFGPENPSNNRLIWSGLTSIISEVLYLIFH